MWGDTPIKTLDSETWLAAISMVLQEVYLFHETIRENILFGRKDASEQQMIRAAKKANCHDFIMKLPQEYDTVAGEACRARYGLQDFSQIKNNRL